MTKLGLSPEQRFWLHVAKQEENECWIWTGVLRHGYGQFGSMAAHRFSYELVYGPIPEGEFVLHKCNNPPCVNPKHLETGDQKHNLEYAASLGRMQYAPNIDDTYSRAKKLTVYQVIEIKKMLAQGIHSRVIAESFPVLEQSIDNIKTGKSWKYVTLDDDFLEKHLQGAQIIEETPS